MLLKPLFALILVSLSLGASAFDLKQEIAKLQAKFGRVMKYPILIVDKEELQWRFAQAGALGDSDQDEQKRLPIIQAYVSETIGVEITETEAAQYEIYTTVLKEGAYALPILASRYPSVYKMCAVFPASPHTNQRLEHNRLLGFDNTEIHQGQSYDDLEQRLPYEVIARFSLYHELAHCLDTSFMPQSFDFEDAHTVHLSESFAETVALLMLKNEGFTDIAVPRAHHRSVYAWRMGRYFAQNPQGGFGSPYYVAGGVIYSLAPVLLAADALAPGHDIPTQAKEVVLAHALPGRAFTAITNWLGKPEETEATYARYAQDAPDLFLEAFEKLMQFKQTIPAMAEASFRSTGASIPVTGEIGPLDPELCGQFRRGQKTAFQSTLQGHTLELRRELGSPAAQTQRQLELQNIYTRMQQRCTAL